MELVTRLCHLFFRGHPTLCGVLDATQDSLSGRPIHFSSFFPGVSSLTTHLVSVLSTSLPLPGLSSHPSGDSTPNQLPESQERTFSFPSRTPVDGRSHGKVSPVVECTGVSGEFTRACTFRALPSVIPPGSDLRRRKTSAPVARRGRRRRQKITSGSLWCQTKRIKSFLRSLNLEILLTGLKKNLGTLDMIYQGNVGTGL